MPSCSRPGYQPWPLNVSAAPARPAAQNVLGLLIAVLLIAYSYVTAEPKRPQA